MTEIILYFSLVVLVSAGISGLKNSKYSLRRFLRMQVDWSSETFGESKRTLGTVEHIRRELNEILEEPEDLQEWIDVIILGLDGYWRHGGTPETIERDLFRKAAINRTRVYPRPASDDVAAEHDRSADELKQYELAIVNCVSCAKRCPDECPLDREEG